MKATTCVLLFSTITLGFGAPDLLPKDQREKSYIIETKLDKKKAFKKIIVWSAKTFANANETVRLKDEEIGMFVAKGNLSCEALKLGSGYAKDQRVDFTLEISVENKKVEVKITDLIGTSSGSYDAGSRPSKKEEMEAVAKECLEPFIEDIKKELI